MSGNSKLPEVLPPIKTRKLATIENVRKQMVKLFWEARHGKINSKEAGRLIWMLKSIAETIRDSEIEKRLEALEARREK